MATGLAGGWLIDDYVILLGSLILKLIDSWLWFLVDTWL